MRSQTQWTIGAMGGFLGLNYTAVITLIEFVGKADKQQVFEDVQVMERAALMVLNKKAGH